MRHSTIAQNELVSWLSSVLAAFCVTLSCQGFFCPPPLGLNRFWEPHRINSLFQPYFRVAFFCSYIETFIPLTSNININDMSFSDYPLDAAMSRSYFESIIPAKRESYTSYRDSFSSDRTLVDTPQPRRPATSHTSNRPSCKRSITTSTTTTEKSMDTIASSSGKRKKVKTFLKRLGNGMLESLA